MNKLTAAAFGLLLLSLALSGVSTGGPSAEAHTMTGGTGGTQVCLNSYSNATVYLYDNKTPSDKTWNFWYYILLNGGDWIQWARWQADWFDNSYGTISLVREYGTGPYFFGAQGGSMSAHIGGSFDLTFYINNLDGDYQCYDLLYRAMYY